MMNRFLERARSWVFDHFEAILVVVLVASLFGINFAVVQRYAFLNFYYLPVLAAGFYVGRRTAMLTGVFISVLVGYFVITGQLDIGTEGVRSGVFWNLIPWSAFLILSGYLVGTLSEVKDRHLRELRDAHVATLEILTRYLETAERHLKGHAKRVADIATALGRQLEMGDDQLQDVRIAGLFHDLGEIELAVGGERSGPDATSILVPVSRVLRNAGNLIRRYEEYYELVGGPWDVEDLDIPLGVRVLAVADAYATLTADTPYRAAKPAWEALAEIERASGRQFDRSVVRALREIAPTLDREPVTV
ncbi:MAG: HD domain-containing protein [Gemmatimonadetes bacterium]|nr:HD domain-containing protein [Gemmatimonadota bacterium]